MKKVNGGKLFTKIKSWCIDLKQSILSFLVTSEQIINNNIEIGTDPNHTIKKYTNKFGKLLGSSEKAKKLLEQINKWIRISVNLSQNSHKTKEEKKKYLKEKLLNLKNHLFRKECNPFDCCCCGDLQEKPATLQVLQKNKNNNNNSSQILSSDPIFIIANNLSPDEIRNFAFIDASVLRYTSFFYFKIKKIYKSIIILYMKKIFKINQNETKILLNRSIFNKKGLQFENVKKSFTRKKKKEEYITKDDMTIWKNKEKIEKTIEEMADDINQIALVLNTCYSESINSLRNNLASKDHLSFDKFKLSCYLSYLIYNLGREETMKRISNKLGVEITYDFMKLLKRKDVSRKNQMERNKKDKPSRKLKRKKEKKKQVQKEKEHPHPLTKQIEENIKKIKIPTKQMINTLAIKYLKPFFTEYGLKFKKEDKAEQKRKKLFKKLKELNLL